MWVFGYGSLMWDEWENKFEGKRYNKAKLTNYHREFNKKSTSNWGSVQYPGPTLGLEEEQGSECIGCAFEFSEDIKEEIIMYLTIREGSSFSLIELDVTLESGDTIKAFIPINSRLAHTFIGNLDLNKRAQMAKTAIGSHGNCIEYISNIRNKLAELNIEDRHIQEFWNAINKND
jgi:cation transport protein ChaC